MGKFTSKLKAMKKTVYNKIVFSEEEKAFLRDNFTKISSRKLAVLLGKKRTRVRMELYAMGLKYETGTKWTAEQVKYLKDNYKIKGNKDIVQYFEEKYPKDKKWKGNQINKKLKQLKLKRTGEEIKAIYKKYVSDGVYKEANLRCRLKRNNLKPIGTIWTQRAGQKMNVVTKTEKGIELYHRVVWQRHFGAIPPGSNIQFKDGNNLNCSIDNLYMITREKQVLFNRKNGRPVDGKKISASYKETVRKEILRLKYGLPPKTKLKLVNIY